MQPPATGAAAVIFDQSGHVLLVRENYGRRRWSLPGGAVEEGETPKEAVVREAREEASIVVEVDHLIGSYGLDDGFTASAFKCSIAEGRPTASASGEIAEVGWFPAGELPKPRSNILHYAIPDALAGRRGVVRVGLQRVS